MRFLARLILLIAAVLAYGHLLSELRRLRHDLKSYQANIFQWYEALMAPLDEIVAKLEQR